MHVLVMDDDPLSCRLKTHMLEEKGHRVSIATTGQEALARLESSPPDVVVLDVTMPPSEAPRFCQLLRAVAPQTRLLVITGDGETARPRRGPERAAYAVLVKPYAPSELSAHIEALVRPQPSSSEQADACHLTAGNIELCGRDLRAVVSPHGGTKTARLSPTEAKLLARLMTNPDGVTSRQTLLYAIGRAESLSEPSTTIDVYIHRLRKKIEKQTGLHRLITSVRGVGYRLNVRSLA
jgi:DNA-binding response OmpR family regulator